MQEKATKDTKDTEATGDKIKPQKSKLYIKLSSEMEKSIETKIEIAFYELTQLMIYIRSNMLWEASCPKLEQFKQYEDYIFEKYRDLDKNILLSEKEKEIVNGEIESKIKEMEKLFKPIYLYKVEIKKYSDIFDYYDRVKNFEGATVDSSFVSRLTKSCLKFCSHVIEEDSSFEHIGHILSAIPIQMPRKNYHDIVKNEFINLTKILENKEIELLREKLCEVFFPSKIKEYSDLIPDIYNQLSKLEEMLCGNDILSVVEEGVDLADELIPEIGAIMEYASTIYSLYRQYLFLMSKSDNVEELLKNDYAIKDMYFTVINSDIDEPFESYFEPYKDVIINSIDENKSSLLSKLRYIDEKVIDITSKIKWKAEEVDTIKECFNYIEHSGHFYYDLEYDIYSPFSAHKEIFKYFLEILEDKESSDDEEVKKENEIAKKEFVNEQCKLLIDYIKSSIVQYPNKIQKHIRQLFFRELKLVLDPEEFKRTIENNLEPLTDAEKLAVEQSVQEIFMDFGYYDYDSDDDWLLTWEDEEDED